MTAGLAIDVRGLGILSVCGGCRKGEAAREESNRGGSQKRIALSPADPLGQASLEKLKVATVGDPTTTGPRPHKTPLRRGTPA